MNIYFKSIGDHETTLYELNDEYYCLRAIFLTPSATLNTNLPSRQAECSLPECCFSDFIDEITPIPKQEFLSHWNQSISNYLHHWDKLKSNYKIGEKIEAKIVCFYPQGVIVQYSEIFYGLANYKECLSILGSQKMYPNHLITLYVEHFDDENLWINFSTHPL